MKRHSQQVKEKALELWKSGRELEEISKELKILFKTLKTWHFREDWSTKRKDQKKANEGKVKEKISEIHADKEIKVLEKTRKLQEKLNPLLDKAPEGQEEIKPIEKIATVRALTELYKLEGKITGEISDIVKHQGDINLKVIPILGGISKSGNESSDGF